MSQELPEFTADRGDNKCFSVLKYCRFGVIFLQNHIHSPLGLFISEHMELFSSLDRQCM